MKYTNARFDQERRRFPITERFAYLDHASRGPLSPPASELIEKITRDMAMLHPHQLLEMNREFEDARRNIATLIGAPSGSIGFIPNTSSGLAMAAGSLPITKGQNIVCARNEFPANIYPWLNQREKGVEVRFIDPSPCGVTADDVRAAMDGKTGIVALSWVGFSDGARIDTRSIGSLCSEKKVFFVVDAIQGTGALKVDLEDIDILVNGTGKWTLAPQGGGFVYVRPGLIERLHPDRTGWLSMNAFAGLENFDRLTDYRFELAKDARRIETGSNSPLVQRALGASSRYLHELGTAAIEERIIGLCDRLIEGLRQKDLAIMNPLIEGQRSGIVCFRPADAAKAVEKLIARDVLVSAREGNVRVGIHFYNNEEDIDRLLDGV